MQQPGVVHAHVQDFGLERIDGIERDNPRLQFFGAGFEVRRSGLLSLRRAVRLLRSRCKPRRDHRPAEQDPSEMHSAAVHESLPAMPHLRYHGYSSTTRQGRPAGRCRMRHLGCRSQSRNAMRRGASPWRPHRRAAASGRGKRCAERSPAGRHIARTRGDDRARLPSPGGNEQFEIGRPQGRLVCEHHECGRSGRG